MLPGSQFWPLEAVVHVKFDRVRCHTQARDIFHLEVDIGVDEVIAENAENVEKYKSGKTQLVGFFVGQVMKLTKGKANPALVNELLKNKLG